MSTCKIIVIEGGDKVGKQTQTEMLYDALAENHSVTLVEIPAKGLTHKAIYWMLRNGAAQRFPNVFQFIQFVNKLAFQTLVLSTMEAMSDYIILDRWSLSAIVYGDATGVNRRFNRFLYDLLRKPDITLIMHGQSFKREGSDSYEKDTKLQKAVKDGYFDWARRYPGKNQLVSNIGTREEVHSTVMGVLKHEGIIE